MQLSKPFSLNDLKKYDIPKEMGLYALIEKESHGIAYIGTATNNKYGLYQRIWNQHMNPVYLETRNNVFSELDIYQLEHPIYHNGQLAIDKSTFRRKVARHYLLHAGQECVDFIKEHFLLSLAVYPPDEQENILHRSQMLIKAHQPLYNGRLHKKLVSSSISS
jgi:hypothetical protein